MDEALLTSFMAANTRLATRDAIGGPCDIIVHTGGSQMPEEIELLRQLFIEMLKPGGVLICENSHTSYWSEFGGKDADAKRTATADTLIEAAKGLADSVNGHFRDQALDYFTRWCCGVHFYTGCIVLEKSQSAVTEALARI